MNDVLSIGIVAGLLALLFSVYLTEWLYNSFDEWMNDDE